MTAPVVEIKSPDNPDCTMVVPFSRPWAYQRWLDMFAGLDLPGRTELIAIVDHNDSGFASAVCAGLSAQKDKLCGLRLLVTGSPPLAEWDEIESRRTRICGHWHTFLALAQGEIILGAEDDTLPLDSDAYVRLVGHLQDGADFAQGTIVGRWDAGIVPHWTRSSNGWATGSYAGDDLVDIQGGGWFCFAAYADDMRAVEFSPRPDSPVGPDVWTCYQLSQFGRRCIGDWTIQCLHVAETMDLSPNRHVVDRVELRQIGKRWRRDIVPGSGRIVDGREIQLAGSQPRPIESRGLRPVRTIRCYGDGEGTITEHVELAR